jgi:hypothetical protein
VLDLYRGVVNEQFVRNGAAELASVVWMERRTLPWHENDLVCGFVVEDV